jgi:hypothetical protein
VEAGIVKPTEIAKPSDNWNIATVTYDRLVSDEKHPHGYIPGDVYANVFRYWSRPDDVVVAPMAGSGMIFQVYEDRARWMGEEPWGLDLRGADLNPRGAYKSRIVQGDACEEIEGPADLIVADIPYFGRCENLYSDDPADLGNMDLAQHDDALARLARSCRRAQPPGGRTVIIAASAYVDLKTGQEVQLSVRILDAFRRAGYELRREAYSPLRIQQRQDPTMAYLNNLARERQIMLCDMAVVLCFEATDHSSGFAELLAAWARTTDEERAAFAADHADELRRMLDGSRP